MPDLVNLTIDGKPVAVPPGTLVIDAAKSAGIEIPAFCYYEGLSLQAACRMCLVEVEKMPKLMTACTLPVSEGMVVRTDTPQVHSARKYMLEFLLTNHPLDCPVCDKGGECELQDMTFRYGVGESRFTDEKVHTPEKQFSPVVFFDAPRCILCYRCVRICNEGLGVGALGVINRGVVSEIAPNKGDHLECDECGACIDICPVGALTSGIYRYKTRPWEMTHVGTTCTHCGDGCKTTLGTRNDRIIRGNNRDRSGINGEFLCIKGRYAFDFYDHPERLQAPLIRVNGELQETSWADALDVVAKRFNDTVAAGGSFGVIGSNRTTNEENYYLQKFARTVLGTNNIDHHRTGDVVTLLDALSGSTGKLATVADLYQRKALLLLGSDLALEHPLLSYQIRANYRHHQAHIYAVTPGPVREDKYSTLSLRVHAPATKDVGDLGVIPGRDVGAVSSGPGAAPVGGPGVTPNADAGSAGPGPRWEPVNGPGQATASPVGAVNPKNVREAQGGYFDALEELREKLKAEPELVILFDDSFKGEDVRRLVAYGESLGIPVSYICLVDYANSRGALDMGLTPEVYMPHQNLCMDFEGTEANYIAGAPYVGADVKFYAGPGGNRGFLTAWDPINKAPAWQIKESFPVWSGALATAGDVVFYGTMEGWFKAVDARTGQLLWQFKTGSGIIGQPVTYKGPDGKQYVAILSGIGGWPGAIVSGDLDTRDATAAGGWGRTLEDLPNVTTKGGTLYVFALP
jgi:NADH-quinone oxidoreductase subunit G